ncbi:MAG: hypothetical protein ACKOCK_06005, partial [Chloroflexota bacterium]
MDQSTFDRIVRRLGDPLSRRSGLRAAVAAVLVAAVATTTSRLPEPEHAVGRSRRRRHRRDHATERRRGSPRPSGPCGDGSPKANRCEIDDECCTGWCYFRRCRCKPNALPCATNEQCCSGLCDAGSCVGGFKKAGARCLDTSNCEPPLTCIKSRCIGDEPPTATPASSGTPAPSATSTNTPAPTSTNTPAPTSTTTPAPTATNTPVPTALPTGWVYSTKFGSSGSGDTNFSSPTCVAVSSDFLTAWIADSTNNRVTVWTRPDTSSTTWSFSTKFGTVGSGDTNLNGPNGLAVASDGLSVWVADTLNHRLVIWTRPDIASTTWSFSTKFGTGGAG